MQVWTHHDWEGKKKKHLNHLANTTNNLRTLGRGQEVLVHNLIPDWIRSKSKMTIWRSTFVNTTHSESFPSRPTLPILDIKNKHFLKSSTSNINDSTYYISPLSNDGYLILEWNFSYLHIMFPWSYLQKHPHGCSKIKTSSKSPRHFLLDHMKFEINAEIQTGDYPWTYTECAGFQPRLPTIITSNNILMWYHRSIRKKQAITSLQWSIRGLLHFCMVIDTWVTGVDLQRLINEYLH